MMIVCFDVFLLINIFIYIDMFVPPVSIFSTVLRFCLWGQADHDGILDRLAVRRGSNSNFVVELLLFPLATVVWSQLVQFADAPRRQVVVASSSFESTMSAAKFGAWPGFGQFRTSKVSFCGRTFDVLRIDQVFWVRHRSGLLAMQCHAVPSESGFEESCLHIFGPSGPKSGRY